MKNCGITIKLKLGKKKNLNSISHTKLSKGFSTGKVFKNKDSLIKKHTISLNYLYQYDKRN